MRRPRSARTLPLVLILLRFVSSAGFPERVCAMEYKAQAQGVTAASRCPAVCPGCLACAPLQRHSLRGSAAQTGTRPPVDVITEELTLTLSRERSHCRPDVTELGILDSESSRRLEALDSSSSVSSHGA